MYEGMQGCTYAQAKGDARIDGRMDAHIESESVEGESVQPVR